MSTRTAPILIFDEESGQEVERSLLYDPSYQELTSLDTYWRPYVRFAIPEFDMRRVSQNAVPDYVVWSWSTKMSLARRVSWRFFCITYRNAVQGALVMSTTPAACKAITHQGALALGVEFLATAPWNVGRFMRSIRREPYLGLIGATLMRVAIALSQETPGCDGRLYLYAVPKAEEFYREHCGMMDLGLENHETEVLRRFEMTTNQAADFTEVRHG